MATRRLVGDSYSSNTLLKHIPPSHDIEEASMEENNMSMEDKLRLIDHEVRILHRFCVDRGYNPLQVERLAQPLLSSVYTSGTKPRWCWGTVLYAGAILVALVTGMVYCDPVYKSVCATTRIAAIKILPYWDWSHLYHQECLIENPYFHGNELTEDDCLMCEDLEFIGRSSNVSHMSMAEDFLKRDVPVIVTDAMKSWEASSKFNVHFLHQLYSHEESLRDTMPCMFASNIRVKYSNVRILLGKAARGEISNWYAHWENCEKQAAKVIRQFYGRPYFIPPMVEMAESNWMFLASGYKGKKYKPADLGLPMMFLAQIKGETRIELSARNPCNKICSKLYATLQEGEILVVTDLLWLVDYMPVGPGDTLMIGAGGYFD